LDTDFFYELSRPNFFISVGSLVPLAVQIMNDTPGQKQTIFMILNGAKKATSVNRFQRFVSVCTKNLNIPRKISTE
jgi:hypothetical protein